MKEKTRQLHDILEKASQNHAFPRVIAYNRIDGPGSSLDLREFQQALWSMPNLPRNLHADPRMKWTRRLPRTVGITIDAGTMIEARPFEPDKIGVTSIDYDTEIIGDPGAVLPIRENWLLKVLDVFRLSGVMFIIQNLKSGTISAGLGGSATVMTGVCILANELAGRPLSPTQLIAMASRMEQDIGVSITGTQEQSNVIFGGITDYVWFPWGIPGRPETGYGDSIRTELIPPQNYSELEKRMAIFHTKRERSSTDVNLVWRNMLKTSEGYRKHSKKLELAYLFREGLRLRKWKQVKKSIEDYREIRTDLCSYYMRGAEEIFEVVKEKEGVSFPMGAGGGGAVLVFCPEPELLLEVSEILSNDYPKISFNILPKGHEIINL